MWRSLPRSEMSNRIGALFLYVPSSNSCASFQQLTARLLSKFNAVFFHVTPRLHFLAAW